MSAVVVCISRTLGGGGETVGRLVADRLGFRYVDEAIIALASDKAHVNPGLVAEAEHRKPLLDRVLDALAANAPIAPLISDAPALGGIAYYGSAMPVMPAALRPNFRALIREAISEIAAQGRAVIVAHAASMALAGTEGVLRVLVTASEQTRIDRLLAGGQVANEGEASKAVKHSDRERRDYLRDFYHVHDELPTHYDLVINTDCFLAERAASVVVAAAA